MITWLHTNGLRLLLALGLSFALWVFVSLDQNPDRRSDPFTLDVEVEGLTPGLVSVDEEGVPRTEMPEVSVVVEADADTLSNLRSSHLRAFVDLSGATAGEITPPVEIEAVDFNGRLDFLTPEPADITVRLDELITQTIPVTIEVNGDPPFGFEAEAPQIAVNGSDENIAEVHGPENKVEQVTMANAVVSIDRLSANFNSSLQLQPRDADGNIVAGVTLSPATADVEIPITSVVGVKRVPVLGSIDGFPASGYTVVDIQSDPQLVNLSGGSDVLESVEQIETVPVNISDLTGTITQTVDLRYPDGTSAQDGTTQAVVTVRIAEISRLLQIRLPVPVEIEGTEAGLVATPNPLFVLVDFSGPVDAFGELDGTSLVATVDVSDLTPGVSTLQPQITVPGTITIVNVPEVTVTVRQLAQPTPVVPTPEAEAESEPSATPTATASPEDAPTEEEAPTEQEGSLPTDTPPPENNVTNDVPDDEDEFEPSPSETATPEDESAEIIIPGDIDPVRIPTPTTATTEPTPTP